VDIPRLSFAHLPTPIEALPRLSDALGEPRLLIKRDDAETLKLELLLEIRDELRVINSRADLRKSKRK
jgi:hypothetical protein